MEEKTISLAVKKSLIQRFIILSVKMNTPRKVLIEEALELYLKSKE